MDIKQLGDKHVTGTHSPALLQHWHHHQQQQHFVNALPASSPAATVWLFLVVACVDQDQRL